MALADKRESAFDGLAEDCAAAKPCEHCGRPMTPKRFPSGGVEHWSQFAVRRFCDRACMSAAFVDRVPTDSAPLGRRRARRLVPHGPCWRCGQRDGIHVHHVDRNPLNNAPENLERLCVGCHAAEHADEHRKGGVCPDCGEPARARGYCTKHYWQHANAREVVIGKQGTCSLCDRPARVCGLCRRHYQAYWRATRSS